MPTKDIFNNQAMSTQVITAAGALVTWNKGLDGDGSPMAMVMTGIRISYGRQARNVNPINTAGSTGYKQYRVYGNASGTLTIGSIVTPDMSDLNSFLSAAGDACGGGVSLNLHPFAVNCDNSNKQVWEIRGATMNQADIDVQGGEIAIVSNQLTLMFTSLSFGGTNMSL